MLPIGPGHRLEQTGYTLSQKRESGTQAPGWESAVPRAGLRLRHPHAFPEKKRPARLCVLSRRNYRSGALPYRSVGYSYGSGHPMGQLGSQVVSLLHHKKEQGLGLIRLYGLSPPTFFISLPGRVLGLRLLLCTLGVCQWWIFVVAIQQASWGRYGKILPGFRIPLGSNTCLMARSRSSSAWPKARGI